MLCRMCRNDKKKVKAVIYIRHHRLALCAEDFVVWLERQVEKTIRSVKMLKKNEELLVAVSGGKDSLSLWFVLHKLGYKATGLHINLGIEEVSESAQRACEGLAERIGAPLKVVNLRKEIGYSIKELSAKLRRRDICSVCGTIKRYLMNKVAIDKGINVVATGHNLDDETAQLLSNVTRWDIGYLGRQSPVLPEREGLARRIKPFCMLTEKETVSYAILNDIGYSETPCPYSFKATSPVFKRALAMLEHQMPGTKLRFYREFLRKGKPTFEEKTREQLRLNKCGVCGAPTTAELCSVCRMLKAVKEC